MERRDNLTNMKLTKKEVEKIAELARLKINDKDLDFYAKELSGVLDYVEQLNKAKTDKIEPMAQVMGLSNVYRDDEEWPMKKNVRADLVAFLMKLAPFKFRNFVKVKGVLKK